jgi:hypothetical protein
MTGKRVLVIVLVLVVALVVIRGVMIIGSPSEERTRRMDSRRVDDLQRISSAIEVYYRRHQQVPASFDELVKEPGLGTVARDPVTSEPYSYRVLNAMSYQLCGTFERESSDGRRADFWAHGTGQQCFTVNIKNDGGPEGLPLR